MKDAHALPVQLQSISGRLIARGWIGEHSLVYACYVPSLTFFEFAKSGGQQCDNVELTYSSVLNREPPDTRLARCHTRSGGPSPSSPLPLPPRHQKADPKWRRHRHLDEVENTVVGVSDDD